MEGENKNGGGEMLGASVDKESAVYPVRLAGRSWDWLLPHPFSHCKA